MSEAQPQATPTTTMTKSVPMGTSNTARRQQLVRGANRCRNQRHNDASRRQVGARQEPRPEGDRGIERNAEARPDPRGVEDLRAGAFGRRVRPCPGETWPSSTSKRATSVDDDDDVPPEVTHELHRLNRWTGHTKP